MMVDRMFVANQGYNVDYNHDAGYSASDNKQDGEDACYMKLTGLLSNRRHAEEDVKK